MFANCYRCRRCIGKRRGKSYTYGTAQACRRCHRKLYRRAVKELEARRG